MPFITFDAQEKYAQISWFVIWSLLYQLMSHITCLSHYARHNHINLMAYIINTEKQQATKGLRGPIGGRRRPIWQQHSSKVVKIEEIISYLKRHSIKVNWTTLFGTWGRHLNILLNMKQWNVRFMKMVVFELERLTKVQRAPYW